MSARARDPDDVVLATCKMAAVSFDWDQRPLPSAAEEIYAAVAKLIEDNAPAEPLEPPPDVATPADENAGAREGGEPQDAVAQPSGPEGLEPAPQRPHTVAAGETEAHVQMSSAPLEACVSAAEPPNPEPAPAPLEAQTKASRRRANKRAARDKAAEARVQSPVAESQGGSGDASSKAGN